MSWGLTGGEWLAGAIALVVVGTVWVVLWETSTIGKHNRQQREFMKSPEFWSRALKIKPLPPRSKYIEKMQKAIHFRDPVGVERVYSDWTWAYRHSREDLAAAEEWRQRAIAAIFKTKGGEAKEEDIF